MKIVKKFQLKIVIFTAVKNRCILHGRVFVMPFSFLAPDHIQNAMEKVHNSQFWETND